MWGRDVFAWRSSFARRLGCAGFFALTLSGLLPDIAAAQTFTVPSGTTDTTPKTLSGTQTGTVESGGTLRSTSGTATIIWNNTSTGVVITNSGVIENTSTGRAIDSSGGATPRTLTFLNNIGAILRTAQADAFRINTNATSGTIIVDNAGLIQAGGTGYAGLGQALDFRTIAAGTASLTITNRATGIIEALTDDAVRPGQNAIINNFGIIRSFGANTSGGANGTADAIDAGARTGVVVNNQSGGLISGARHGITAENDITVNNQGGATILGRNGSGIGSDGNGTVINYGTITGTYAGVGNIFNSDGTAKINGDGDGVDIDNVATITNYGLIQGTGAGGFDSGGRANNSEGLALGGGSVENYGTVSGSRGILVNKDTNVDRSGVAATTINNYAGASITGTSGFAIRLENKTGTAIDNDTIINRGTIIGGGAIPDPNEIILMESGAVDTNSTGTLDGIVYTGTGAARFIRGDGSAIQMGEGNDTLTNYGTITGLNGRAINLEGGADTLNVMSGSKITGLVNGGADADILNYNKIGLTEAKRAALQAGQTVNIGGTLYTSFETVNGAAQAFSSFASNANSRAVAGILDNGSNNVGASAAMVAMIDTIASASDVNAALAQLTPVQFQALSGFGFGGMQTIGALTGQRMTDTRLNGVASDFSGAQAAMAMFNEGLFSRRSVADQAFASLNANPQHAFVQDTHPQHAMAYAPTKAPGMPVLEAERGVFFNSNLTIARQGARSDAPATRARTASIVTGFDWRASDNLIVGLLGSYAHTRGDLDQFGSTTSISTGTAGAFATYHAPRWFASVLALHGWSQYENERMVFGTPHGSAFTGRHYTLRGSVGTDWRSGQWLVTPEAGLQFARVMTPGFTESGPAALTIGADSADSLRTSLGVRIAYDVRVSTGTITPELRAQWQHEFNNGVRAISASFVDPGLPGTFQTTAQAGSRDVGTIGVGVSGRLGAMTAVALGYDLTLGSYDAVAHSISGRLRHAF